MQKRKMQRRHLIYYLRVFHTENGKLLGHLVDITPDGVMLTGEAALELNKEYACEMLLPKEISGTQKICFLAKCVWTKRDVNPDFYASGLQIRDISERDIDLIGSLVERFGFHD